MNIRFKFMQRFWTCELQQGRSIAIELDFDGAQPNHFGTPRAVRKGLELGGFTGRTDQGGSCNVDVIEMIPHCNGTHTESVSHIVNELVPVGEVAPQGLVPALLVSVTPQHPKDLPDRYRPAPQPEDRMVSREDLQQQLDKIHVAPGTCHAIVIRTLPNERSKKSRDYAAHSPAFLSVDAMKLINQMGFDHLLVDTPSVDRAHDEGLLTNHHLFWNVEEKTHKLGEGSWKHKTITEMVYVPDELADGFYLLALQVPNFKTDAAPSRPILFPMQPDHSD